MMLSELVDALIEVTDRADGDVPVCVEVAGNFYEVHMQFYKLSDGAQALFILPGKPANYPDKEIN